MIRLSATAVYVLCTAAVLFIENNYYTVIFKREVLICKKLLHILFQPAFEIFFAAGGVVDERGIHVH